MNDTLMRQWAMLRAIPRYPRRIDAPTIHARLGDLGMVVSLRTVQRDLNAMAETFPLDFDESKPQGWCWREGASQLEVPSMDAHAALTFNLVEQYTWPDVGVRDAVAAKLRASVALGDTAGTQAMFQVATGNGAALTGLATCKSDNHRSFWLYVKHPDLSRRWNSTEFPSSVAAMKSVRAIPKIDAATLGATHATAG